jgi:hypothetical protein
VISCEPSRTRGWTTSSSVRTRSRHTGSPARRQTSPLRIDVLTSISGVDFDEAWASRLHVVLEGLPVLVLGKDALIKNKRASGREKDLLDVKALERG